MKNFINIFLKNNQNIIVILLLVVLCSACVNRYNKNEINSADVDMDVIGNLILENITTGLVVINENFISNKYYDSIIKETQKYKNYQSLRDIKEIKSNFDISEIKFRKPFIFKSEVTDSIKLSHLIITYISFSKPYINKRNEVIIYNEYYVGPLHGGGDIYVFSLDKNKKWTLKHKYIDSKS
ncbi:hypothetical protein GCM10010984_07180 [Chishuiella changwenlii]|uniref:Lipoprotein n=1 Tax=Chishuiella changwenlii TaxID=1434701 RepID=A0ABQ1TCR6_9FLAO|nr:hypothetical protein [Chishuiella changwenlii]GGE92079.1 hypothetical protein GCM10010984_07180 [Chishuiella changwenlii]